VDFRILGPLEVRDSDRLVPLGGARQRAVLALLLTRAIEVVSRDWLIDVLWGEHPPESAINVLQKPEVSPILAAEFDTATESDDGGRPSRPPQTPVAGPSQQNTATWKPWSPVSELRTATILSSSA
jgi:hypothetical protein